MINLMNLEENKVSTDLTQYPMVWMGETGDGKTYSMNKFLTEISPEGKKPLFLMFEDRHKKIPGIMAQRIHSISDLFSIVSQFKNPKVREKFSCVVFDTVDKFEEMASRYTAANKEVEIIEDLNFGKGKRYLNGIIGITTELKNLGVTVHFIAQAYTNTDIMTKETTVQTKLKDVTKAQIFHEAFLVGIIKKKSPVSEERIVTFKKTDTFRELKDSFGLPELIDLVNLKDEFIKTFDDIDPSMLTSEKTITNVEDTDTFDNIKSKGLELGGLLAQNGHLEEATNILKTTIGTNDNGSAKMFDSLVESQVDLAKVVVIKLEELVTKYNLS
jgi:hypothetical protein